LLSEYYRKKLLHHFRCLDADNSGFIGKEDAEIFASRFAQLRNAEPGSEIHKDVLSKWLYIWENFWSKADSDGDGKVSPEEFCQGIEQGIEEAVSNPDYKDPLIEILFDIVDLDGDGQISQEEHRLFFSMFEMDAETSAFVFSKLDINQDGILSKQEFVSAKKEFLTEKEPGAVGNWFWGSVD
jgi:Ca2+-binding EF-hand superfamily protein